MLKISTYSINGHVRTLDFEKKTKIPAEKR